VIKSETSSITKVFGLLEFLAAEPRPASLQTISEAVKLSKPTAYRLLQSLHQLGYVTRPSNSRDYLIGPRTARLASADPYAELKSAVRPILRRLHEALNETVNLGVLPNGQVIYLDYLETSQPLRYIVTPGQSDPFYCTALGRAIAAQLDERQLERLLAKTRLHAHTPQTVKSLPELRRRIAKARETGIAEEIEESVSGVCCLATSLGPLGFPEAAISIAIPSRRLTARRKTALINSLKSINNAQYA
jgi:DNA-binding IclR family transcriptional regulator